MAELKSRALLEKRKESLSSIDEEKLPQKKLMPEFEESVISEHTSDSHSVYEKEILVNLKSSIESERSIQLAVDSAEPYTRIKIKAGVYRENIIIKTPFLELYSENPEEPAIILSSQGPCIKIESLKETDTIKISNLRFCNRGIRFDETLRDADISKNFIYQNSNMIENLEINYVMDVNIIEGILCDNRGKISGISVFSGIVMINNCQISLAYLTTLTNVIIPAIYCENSHIFVESVWIKGNKEFLTVGVLAYNSNVKVTSSKFLNHRCGGFLTSVTDNNNITLYKCSFDENTGSGILIKGNAVVVLEDNLIEKNHGVGIKVLDSFKITIIGNKIVENLLNGMELINCDGLVMLNNFYKNKGTGALLEAHNGSFYAKILKNTFLENYQHGIVIKGQNNEAKIINNEKIGLNFLSGIHISEKASPKISDNKIYQNLHQGVLVVTDSFAIIEKNEIFENIKANVAFGGKLAERTVIAKNKIYGSRNEGIFVIEADGGVIDNNEIYDNNDGIIMIKCKDLVISENNIFNNIRTGILISDMSSPKLIKNQIHDNQFLGLFIRDKSTGVYQNNELKMNISQLYLSKNCSKLIKPLRENNMIDGRVDVASTCNIL